MFTICNRKFKVLVSKKFCTSEWHSNRTPQKHKDDLLIWVCQPLTKRCWKCLWRAEMDSVSPSRQNVWIKLEHWGMRGHSRWMFEGRQDTRCSGRAKSKQHASLDWIVQCEMKLQQTADSTSTPLSPSTRSEIIKFVSFTGTNLFREINYFTSGTELSHCEQHIAGINAHQLAKLCAFSKWLAGF